MIVTWPSAPIGERLSVPRPLILLLGSYGGWELRAAKQIEARAGAVVVGSWPQGTPVGEFLTWLVPLLEEADERLFWIAGASWSEWEWGYLLGLWRAGKIATPPVIGVAPTMVGARAAVEGSLEAIRAQVPIWTTLDEALSALMARR